MLQVYVYRRTLTICRIPPEGGHHDRHRTWGRRRNDASRREEAPSSHAPRARPQSPDAPPPPKAPIPPAIGLNEKTVVRLLSKMRWNQIVISEAVHSENGAQLANVYRLTRWAQPK